MSCQTDKQFALLLLTGMLVPTLHGSYAREQAVVTGKAISHCTPREEGGGGRAKSLRNQMDGKVRNRNAPHPRCKHVPFFLHQMPLTFSAGVNNTSAASKAAASKKLPTALPRLR